MKHIYTSKVNKMSPWWTLPIFIFAIIVGFTLAYFFTSDYASKFIGMSGAVKIEAVGAGPTWSSIEDTVSESKLEITLEDNYKVLIPGMMIDMQANCRVYKSTTKPLLRAELDIEFKEMDTGAVPDDELLIMSNMYTQLYDIIIDNDWYLHTDGYFYYLGDMDQSDAIPVGGGGTILKR